jgi:hypothetical protein
MDGDKGSKARKETRQKEIQPIECMQTCKMRQGSSRVY